MGAGPKETLEDFNMVADEEPRGEEEADEEDEERDGVEEELLR